MKSKLIYIASPYAGDVEANVAFAKLACRYAIGQGHTPIAVHLHYPQMLEIEEAGTLGLPIRRIPDQELRAAMEQEPAPGPIMA